mmetsp:Transcript_147/g.296  ORF Transcript_147/g.296 Transcript_147/m.296 type:complete len:613 (+) Transcript_147:7-1845(+)
MTKSLLLVLGLCYPLQALNIITILTDDQGFGDSGYNCENSTGMCAQTPNLDSLVLSEHSALFSRFYSAAAVCSPTRAAYLTGRTNERSCIYNALRCDNEDPADNCSMGKGLPWNEFTTAKAVKKATGNYSTIMIGKWHLGDLWAKTNLPDYAGNYSNPGHAGFDEWIVTEAEASNSMPNCGCFPVNHTNPGPKPPSGYPSITPHGDHCVVGGGFESDWCYPCTNYFYNSSTGVRGLETKVPGNDAEFVVDRFEGFLNKTLDEDRPFYAHLTFHAIHEPHPAMPEYFALYQKDPDYLGALTMFDGQLGRLVQLLKARGVYDDTVIFYTSDNGPHQGQERSDIHWSTNFLRQCKASHFEGGIRTPGFIHAPSFISEHRNITTPAVTQDFLPTIMQLLDVKADHPDWVMDGISLLPFIASTKHMPRPEPIGIAWGGNYALIDNDMKLISKPLKGQCDYQAPYSNIPPSKLDSWYLFNLTADYHELHDLKNIETARYQSMLQRMTKFQASLINSQQNEVGCAFYLSGVLNGKIGAGEAVTLLVTGLVYRGKPLEGRSFDVGSNGAFTFPDPLEEGTTWESVVVEKQPKHSTCDVESGTHGTAGPDMPSVTVVCKQT